MRSDLLALQNTASLMLNAETPFERQKGQLGAVLINAFTASALTNRASDIGGLLDGVEHDQTLQAADSGIKAIEQLVQTAQAAARQALQTSSSTTRYTGTVSNLTGSSSFAVTATKTITINDGTTTATITSGGTVTVQDVIDGVNNAVVSMSRRRSPRMESFCSGDRCRYHRHRQDRIRA